MNRAHLYALVAALFAGAAALFSYKVSVLGFPVLPEQKTEIWRVEAQIRFRAHGGPVKVAVQLPHHTGRWVLIDQSFVSPGYGITTEFVEQGQRAVFTIRQASGIQTLYYRAAVLASRASGADREPATPPVAPPYAGAELQAARSIIAATARESADVVTQAALVLKRLQDARPGDEASLLLGRNPSNARLVNVAAELLQLAGIPARTVNGIALHPERQKAGFTRSLEVHQDGYWRQIHPGPARPESLEHYMPWWRGRAPFVEVEGGAELEYLLATSRSYELAMTVAREAQRALERRLVEFSLFGLPLQAQALYRTILVIPLGILVLVALRNIVGIQTFGTFMPVLIALAFRQTGPLWGVVFFSMVLALGLAVRFYLEHLKLLLVPRLAAVVVVVVLILAVTSVLSYRLGLDSGVSVGLFPIVILTMTIERMTVVWEERGPAEALQQAAGSLLVGVLCYLVMHRPEVEHLAFVFPELLLAVLGLILLIGRYTGYRLVELRRFRTLAG